MARTSRIAIVGAGIGGLTAAAMLQKFGFDCVVYEQAPGFRRVGLGINLAPNSTRVFRAMGVLRRTLQLGVMPRRKFNRAWNTGAITREIPTLDLAQVYHAPFLAIHRGDLHQALASTLDPRIFRLGKRLVSIDQRNEQVHLAFADGTTADADIVLAADGLHSKVREAILGTEPPTYYGHVAYRSIYPRSRLSDVDLADNTRWIAPDGRYVLVYVLSEARDEVYVVTGGPEAWGKDDFMPMEVPPGQLVAAFDDFHSSVLRILAQCTDVSRWPMLVRPPKLPWCVGRVALLGDACHPTTPHMGQGGGMAVEDAVMLARCLQAVNGEDVERAFRLYEHNRFERTSRLKRDSEHDEWGQGRIEHQWLYGYDVLTAPLEGDAQTAG
ncbi:MAG TPA: FAD-dependent monooxygenase [Casimicrobiaceae bacterium]|jgi:6-hydroxynicotinate 3-monooxygenase|nr:FAD-dependent monooxygenase [Casimicrobiaceae bacterium]